MISLEKLARLEIAHMYCDDNDKSAEFMIEFMQSFAEVTHDQVMEYLRNCSGTGIS